jgi:hypothetical protein
MLKPIPLAYVYLSISSQKSTSLDQIFLASRILFLCTASESLSGHFICSIVEGQHHGRTIVEIIKEKLDALIVQVLAQREMSSEAMTDLLKFTFNLLLHYPKVTQFLLDDFFPKTNICLESW